MCLDVLGDTKDVVVDRKLQENGVLRLPWVVSDVELLKSFPKR